MRERRAALIFALLAAGAQGVARAGDVDAANDSNGPSAREVSSLAAREAVLADQATAARASVRWRLRTLEKLASGGAALDGAIRARALDAGTRALARELSESRSLAHERDQLRAERATLAAAARGDEAIGAAPALTLPAPGPVAARFGVAPERATGLLVSQAGVRLAAPAGAVVRAPVAGLVARVATEPEGTAVVIDAGAGWTVIVAGLAEASVAAGARVASGDRLGSAAGPSPGVLFEVWRGRHPVDPLLLVRAAGPARAAPEPLAATPSVP